MKTDPNLPLLEEAVAKLAPFLQEIVFVGGITVGLLITDPAADPIRQTNDVDVIAEIVTSADYVRFSERLRNANFTEDMSERPILCRWHHEELVLDVLPVEKHILGFTNPWYKGALNAASSLTLPSGSTISVITAPFFLGTKMEAFRGRGKTISSPATILRMSSQSWMDVTPSLMKFRPHPPTSASTSPTQ